MSDEKKSQQARTTTVETKQSTEAEQSKERREKIDKLIDEAIRDHAEDLEYLKDK